MRLMMLSALLTVASAAASTCVRTGSSPKCEEPADCCTFSENFTTATRACLPPHDKYPFCDTSRSLPDRVGDLISRIPDDASEFKQCRHLEQILDSPPAFDSDARPVPSSQSRTCSPPAAGRKATSAT